MPKPYIPDDTWARRAREEGYRARSVYKLIDLDERFDLFRPGMTVLDIGAAPGSWLQYVSKQIGERGRVIGLDLQPIEPVSAHVITASVDIADQSAAEAKLRELNADRFDVVLSDIAPSTSGVKDVDQWRSVELSQRVLALAGKFLKPRGTLVMKVFRGADFDAFLREVKGKFRNVKPVSVKASRDRSREAYLVCW